MPDTRPRWTLDDVKRKILHIVVGLQGCKATEICSDTEIAQAAIELGTDAVVGALYQLVEERELVEIEYVLPDLNYRTKSFFLPKGTRISIKG